jgi:hypothetical protein
MSLETIFTLANTAVLPFWLLLIVAPHWVWTRRIAASLWPIGLLAALYTGLLIWSFTLPNPALNPADLANPTLGVIAAGLGTPLGATIGWVHFLAFDLFVGRWAYLDSRERALSAWWVSPTLVFILMAGPLGLLLYLAVRQASGVRRQASDA